MKTEQELKNKRLEIRTKLLYHRIDTLEHLRTLQDEYSLLGWVLGDVE